MNRDSTTDDVYTGEVMTLIDNQFRIAAATIEAVMFSNHELNYGGLT